MQTYLSGPMEIARRYWRVSLVRGVVAILFGLLAIFWPHLTYHLFFYVFGIFAIVEGCLLMINGFSQRRAAHQQAGTYQQGEPARYQQAPPYQQGEPARYQQAGTYQREGFLPHGHRTNPTTLVLEGLLSVICGILALVLPTVAGALVVYAVAAWALFKGIGALMQVKTRGWVMALIGVLAIILAVVLFLNPIGAIRSFLWIVGLFSLIMGIVLVVRAVHHRMTTTREARPVEPGY